MSLSFCGDDVSDLLDQNVVIKKPVTEFYYREWDLDNDQGKVRVSSRDVQSRDKLFYVKTNIEGERLIKGFLFKGKNEELQKHDFWTYYDTKGEISKIEFYVFGNLTQTIKYD